jgi:xanthine dehydrogenase YagS FAD-binding subunit
MNEFSYLEARSVEEAIALKQKHGTESAFVAGATNQLYLMKRGVRKPKFLINVKTINGLDAITFDENHGLEIGSLVKINDLQESQLVTGHYPMLAQCAGKIASPQIRNAATVGGNLSQEVWCWYLAEGFDCWMNGGKYCYAPDGDNRYHHSVNGGYVCLAVHPSDLATAFLALEAKVHVAGRGGGSRVLGIEELLPGFTKVEGKLKQNALTNDEVITLVSIPPLPTGSRGVFTKYAVRDSFDFALSSVAMVMELEGGDYCKGLRVAIGGVANNPFRATRVESELTGRRLSRGLLEACVEKVFKKEAPLNKNAYRIHLTKELVRQAVLELCPNLT